MWLPKPAAHRMHQGSCRRQVALHSEIVWHAWLHQRISLRTGGLATLSCLNQSINSPLMLDPITTTLS